MTDVIAVIRRRTTEPARAQDIAPISSRALRPVRPFVGGDVTDEPASIAPETTAQFYAQNLARLDDQVTADPLTINSEHFGDSLTQSASAGPGGSPWVTLLSGYIAGTHDNEGIGGQTSVQITARLTAQSGSDLAKPHTLMMGTNNLTAYVQIMADYATCDAAVTGDCLMLGPIAAGTIAGTSGMIHRINEQLLNVYGERFLDMRHSMRKAAAQDGELNVRRGGNPADLMYDATHPSNTEGSPVWAREVAAAMRAQAGGAPFVHDDLVLWNSGEAEDDVLHTCRILGTPDAISIASGNDDNLFGINSSGELLRGAGTTYFEGGVREVHVEASATGKGPGHTGRLMTAREAETDQPVYGVTISGTGSILRAPLGSTESNTIFADSAKFSVAMLVRFPNGGTSGDLFMGRSIINKTSGSAVRFAPRDTSGISLGATNTAPAVTDPGEWHAVFLSCDTATNSIIAVSVSVEDGVQTGSAVGTLSSSNLGLAIIDGLFTNNANDAAPWAGDLKFLWAVDGVAIDWTSATERDRFINSSTLAPANIAADGVVNSVTPKIYLRGRVGDYLAGRNWASGGKRFYAPFPINEDEAVFNDATGFSDHVSAAVTLSALSGTFALDEGSAEDTVAGALVGVTSGSTLSLTDDAGGRVKLSGSNIVAGATATDYESATSHSFTVRETLTGATNTPRDTVLSLTVNDVAEASAAETATIAALNGQSSMVDCTEATTTAGFTGVDMSGNGNNLTPAFSSNAPSIDGTLGAVIDGANEHLNLAISGGTFSLAMSVKMDNSDTQQTLVSNSANAFVLLATSGSATALGATCKVDGVSVTTQGGLFSALTDGAEHIVTVEGYNATGLTSLRIGRPGNSFLGSVRRIVWIEEGTVTGTVANARTNAATWVGES